MFIAAIDGACKNNGKPNCISSSAAFITNSTTKADKVETEHLLYSTYELHSSSQRGELKALIGALQIATNHGVETDDIYIITDSEYIYNALTKGWLTNWANKGWVTASGAPVKNKDLWVTIRRLLERLENKNVLAYHIKGHVIPFGKAGASVLIERDSSLKALHEGCRNKVYAEQYDRAEKIAKAKKTFEKNHGYEPKGAFLLDFIALNMVADLYATYTLEKIVNELGGAV